MRTILVLLFTFRLVLTVFSQQNITTYYPRSGNETQIHEEYEISIQHDLQVKNGKYKAYDESGYLILEGQYLEDKKNGEWKFYTHERIDSSGTYTNDLPNGKWTYYTKNEILQAEGNFVNGVKSGKWAIYSKNGDKIIQYDYQKNKTGIETYNAKLNTSISGESYENHTCNGQYFYYYPDGQLRCKLTYHNDSMIDTVRSYFMNGNKLSVCFYDTVGLVSEKVYYKDGQLQKNVIRLDSTLFLKKEYYTNGKIEMESKTKDSIIYSYKAWDSSGNVLNTGNYMGGNGLLIEYDNGNKLSEAHYANYLLNGEFIGYYKNGKIKEKGYFENGKKIGKWTEYLEDGRVNLITDYTLNTTETINKKDFKNTKDVLDKDNTEESGMIMPSLDGGITELMKYLSKSILYPTIARENGLEGKIIAKFNVNLIGEITEIEILKDGVGGGCAQEVMRVIRNMPLWIPGFSNGIPIQTFYTLPVTFKLAN